MYISNKELIESLLSQKALKLRGNIYWKTQIDLAYNSNKIEGSRLSRDQTQLMFDTGSLEGSARVDDIKEADNHFKMFNHMLDTLGSDIGIDTIKHYHLLLKDGLRTEDGVHGDWKRLQNEVGTIKTTSPKEVDGEIRRLIDWHNKKRDASKLTLEDILEFHVHFETIHPFLDGNGRVGRMIMFSQCLTNDITPFIILDEMRGRYFQGLRNWFDNRRDLVGLCEELQEWYQQEYLYLLETSYVVSNTMGEEPAP